MVRKTVPTCAPLRRGRQSTVWGRMCPLKPRNDAKLESIRLRSATARQARLRRGFGGQAVCGPRCGVRGRKPVGGGARGYNWRSLVIIGQIEGCFCLMVAGRQSFLIFSALFRLFPLAGPCYRVIVNWRRPRGLGWAGRGGQSGVVSWWRLYISATHYVKRKNGLGAGASGPPDEGGCT